MTSKIEFLAQLPIFEALDDEELWSLASICTEYEYEDGAVIAYQRDVADSMVIVRSGRLFARAVDERGIVRDTQAYLPLDYFGDVWMFAQTAHPATVKATGPGQAIIIKGSDFLQFLARDRNALAKLEPLIDEADQVVSGLSLEAWEEAQKSRLKPDRRSASVSLLPDELMEFQTRRSRWYLMLRAVMPSLGLLLGPLGLFLLLGGVSEGIASSAVRWVLPLIVALFFGLWLFFRVLDWNNDYFVITSKHLTHHEFRLRSFSTTINKIPLDQIQSVEVERPTFIAQMFDFGTARVTTSAQARSVLFDNIDDPRRVEATLNNLRQRVKALDAGRAQATMRQSIESHFNVQDNVHVADDLDDEDDYDEYEQAEGARFADLWQEFRDRYRWRVEQNGVITYRKHVFVLLREIAWPAGIGLILAIAATFMARGSRMSFGQLVGIFLVLYTIDLSWLIWRIEDWRNDTFQLTDTYVIDIDRKPFGFGESRKLAELSNVQNVNSDRPNFLATIFNFGNVVVETAGATADITFENVSHPNLVQSDVFKRRDQFRQRQLLKDGEHRRKEYSVLLDVYQQAREQGRIPRRTPPSE